MNTENEQNGQFRWYKLNELPDLSLKKYSVYAGNGNPMPFFRQLLGTLHSICSKQNLRIHLLYGYDPTRQEGQRFSVHFGLSGAVDRSSHSPLNRMLRSSLLAPYFPLKDSVDVKYDIEEEITALASKMMIGGRLVKNETFLKASEELAELPEIYRITRGFHFVEDWSPIESCRLINLANTMRSLNVASMYSLTLEPTDRADELKQLYEEPNEGPMYFLKRTRTQFAHDPATAGRSGYQAGSITDDTIDTAKKNYTKLITSLETNQHFLASIEFWSDSTFPETPYLLAEAAASDALKDSSHTFYPYESTLLDSPLPDPAKPLKTLSDPRTSKDLGFLPSLVTIKEAEPFFRFPMLEEGEWIGMRKETDPRPDTGSNEMIQLGKLRFSEDRSPLFFPVKGLTKHTLIVGVPGSGKTNTLMYLARTLWEKHAVPFMILEPAKKEHRGLISLIPGIRLFTPGNPSPDLAGYQFGVNLFAAPVGFPIAEHIANLCMAFNGAFPLTGPLPFILRMAISAVYEKRGIDPNGVMPENANLPTIQELIEAMLSRLDAYGGEVKGNLTGVIQNRFELLTTGFMNDVFNAPIPTMTSEQLLKTPVVMELEQLGKENANLLALVLCTQLREQLAMKGSSKKLRHLLIIEEAHNLIGPVHGQVSENSDPKAAATEYIIKLLAEVRALGQGLVIADQIPSALASEVVKNTNLKICHRLVDKQERDYMGGALLADEPRMEVVATQMPGQSLMLFEGLLKPFYVDIEKADEEEVVPPDNKFLKDQEEAERKAEFELLRRRFDRTKEKLCKEMALLLPSVKQTINSGLQHYYQAARGTTKNHNIVVLLNKFNRELAVMRMDFSMLELIGDEQRLGQHFYRELCNEINQLNSLLKEI